MKSKHSVTVGDVFFAELPNTGGRVINGRRPVVIVSNRTRSTVSVLPVTTTPQKNALSTHVKLGPECGLERPSTALAEQLLCLDIAQLRRFVSHLPRNKMQEIRSAIFSNLGLPSTA